MARPKICLVHAAIILGICSIVALSGCTTTNGGGAASSSPQPSIRMSPMTASSPGPSLPTASSLRPSPIPSASPTVLPTPTATAPSAPAPSVRPTSADPVIAQIGDRQWARIERTGTWRPECPVGRLDLRRLDVNYVDFGGGVRRGDLIAHRDTVDDLAAIFTELFDAGFPIERMDSVEKYGGDVARSLAANNTSAFNCRRPDQINAPVTDSPHASGRAIDINPYQNPWTDPRCNCWVPSADFAEDRSGAGVITKGSLAWRLFTERGWIWQDIRVPDYMHFDTGFPSRPR